MALYLYVEMVNTQKTSESIQYLNEALPFERRVVRVELTEEQAKALEPREVGNSCSPVYEEIHLICLQKEEAPTVEAAGVIRCRDCRHMEAKESSGYRCNLNKFDTEPNGFCWLGVRT